MNIKFNSKGNHSKRDRIDVNAVFKDETILISPKTKIMLDTTIYIDLPKYYDVEISPVDESELELTGKMIINDNDGVYTVNLELENKTDDFIMITKKDCIASMIYKRNKEYDKRYVCERGYSNLAGSIVKLFVDDYTKIIEKKMVKKRNLNKSDRYDIIELERFFESTYCDKLVMGSGKSIQNKVLEMFGINEDNIDELYKKKRSKNMNFLTRDGRIVSLNEFELKIKAIDKMMNWKEKLKYFYDIKNEDDFAILLNKLKDKNKEYFEKYTNNRPNQATEGFDAYYDEIMFRYTSPFRKYFYAPSEAELIAKHFKVDKDFFEASNVILYCTVNAITDERECQLAKCETEKDAQKIIKKIWNKIENEETSVVI